MDKHAYRVKVEVIGDEGEHPIDEKFLKGIECDGFVIIGDQGESSAVSIHHLTVRDIADSIAHSDSLLAASVIAKAYNDAHEMIAKEKMNSLSNLLSSLSED